MCPKNKVWAFANRAERQAQHSRVERKMVRVYYLGDNGEELSPLDASDLVPLGLEYHKLNPQDYDEDLAQIKQKNGYTFHDIIHCDPDHLPDFETKIRYFAEE